MKKKLLACLVPAIFCICLPAAEKDTTSSCTAPRLGVKLSAAALAGVVNPGVEFSVSGHFTVNFEATGCFFPEGFGVIQERAIVAMTFLEGRWYPRCAFRGFFIGPNAGFGVWNMNKGFIPFYHGAHAGEYEVGRNFMCGATLGYMFSFSDHWGMEVSAGGGFSIAGYEGHVKEDGSMFIGDNASSEWIPYKAALSVVYKW